MLSSGSIIFRPRRLQQAAADRSARCKNVQLQPTIGGSLQNDIARDLRHAKNVKIA